MNFLRNWITLIKDQLTHLSVSQKMLIGTLTLITVMMFWVAGQYLGSPEMVALNGRSLDQERLGEIKQFLDMRDIRNEIRGDKVYVPRDESLTALAGLRMNNMMTEDSNARFAELLKEQNWWESGEQGRRRMLIATQDVLGKAISTQPWVQTATVIISTPSQPRGFGRSREKASASVNVVMAQGTLDQRKSDAIVGLVSGAVSGLDAKDVIVIDAVAGRQWKVRDENDLRAGDYLEAKAKAENLYQEKISGMLQYIKGVIVAVNVDIDNKPKQTNSVVFDKTKSVSIVASEKSESTTTNDTRTNAEPGVRANNPADIAAGSKTGRESTSEKTETTFTPGLGKTTEMSHDPGGKATKVNATVNIPRSYFVGLFKAAQGDGADAAEPADTALQPIITAQLPKIQKQIENLVEVETAGKVVVDVYPDGLAGAGAGGGDVATAGAGGFGGLSVASWIPIGLGAMALLFMFYMVKSAGKQAGSMPTAAELAGVPPVLETEEELIGEVREDEMALAGMELDEGALKNKKLAEQVSEMIQTNPRDVAGILKKWVGED